MVFLKRRYAPFQKQGSESSSGLSRPKRNAQAGRRVPERLELHEMYFQLTVFFEFYSF